MANGRHVKIRVGILRGAKPPGRFGQPAVLCGSLSVERDALDDAASMTLRRPCPQQASSASLTVSPAGCLKIFAVARAPAPDFGPQSLGDVDDEVRDVSQPGRVLFELSGAPQALHRVAVIFCAQVALRAVLDHDEREGDTHDSGRKAGAGCPVVGYSVSAVEIVPESGQVNT